MKDDKVLLIGAKDDEGNLFWSFPKGHQEIGETDIETAVRETKEETGFLIKDITPIGYTLERREDVRNHHDYDQSISFVFSALPEKEVGTNYMEDEIAEGFRPIWIRLEDFITEQASNEGKIESYSGCFSNRRDLLIAKLYASLGK